MDAAGGSRRACRSQARVSRVVRRRVAGATTWRMTSRDRRLLLALAALAPALAAGVLAGGHSDLLAGLPALLLALPLLAGRYVGEERLARLAGMVPTATRRVVGSLPTTARRASRVLPRGGHLIAASLAVRPPPAPPIA